MAVVGKPIFPQLIVTGAAQIAPADASNLKTLLTAGADGTRVDNISITSTDTSARDVQFVITISAVDHVLGTISVPANSGFTNSVPTLGVLQNSQFSNLSVDANGNKVLSLASGAVLKAKTLTTVTAAKVVSIIAQAGNF